MRTYDLADKLISSILYQGRSFDRIDVVFDRYRENSIKESTRNRSNIEQRAIRKLIDSRSVSLPHDWLNYMASSENKSDCKILYHNNSREKSNMIEELLLLEISKMTWKYRHQMVS